MKKMIRDYSFSSLRTIFFCAVMAQQGQNLSFGDIYALVSHKLIWFFYEAKCYIYGYINALMPLTLLHCLRNRRSPDLVIHDPLNPQLKGLLKKILLVPVTIHWKADQGHYPILQGPNGLFGVRWANSVNIAEYTC